MEVLVAGGSGFVGQSLCRVLDARGHRVTAASRTPDAPGLPTGVERVATDVTRSDLQSLVAGHEVVVNLVALPSHVQPRGRSHEGVHLAGTRNLVAASRATGVRRFVQLSGLGVESGVSTAYFRAKRRAERVVRESDLEWVVYRPSVVFGDGCAFLPFVERLGAAGVVPLPGGGGPRLQPVWVEDLAPMLADGVVEPRHRGEAYRIGGPERLTLAEVVRLACDGVRVVSVPSPVAAAGFALADLVPGLPLGRDQYRVLGLDNTVADNDVAAFGVSEADLRTLAAYLDGT